jgi:hypothetical protein
MGDLSSWFELQRVVAGSDEVLEDTEVKHLYSHISAYQRGRLLMIEIVPLL